MHLDQGAVPHTLGYHRDLYHEEDNGRSVDFDNIIHGVYTAIYKYIRLVFFSLVWKLFYTKLSVERDVSIYSQYYIAKFSSNSS